ncbi:hypothetical protein GCM10008986_24930 [Salinibacillus aidingensis]|uniref:Uncharacterized protein n=1 Tax=Salinibacillus aidingensis TaxID=237684 RepID=A0ABN1BFQ2_9BACI
MKKSIAKSLSLIMVICILATSLPVQAVQAATETPQNQIEQFNIKKNGVLYEDDTFKVTQTDNSRTTLNKKTNNKVELTFTNSNQTKGIYTDINGNEKKYSTDADGNIYLDGERFIEVNHSKKISPNGYTNPKYFKGKDGFTYYYVNTTSYNTKLQGDVESIALGILSFVPYVGTIFAVSAIIADSKGGTFERLWNEPTE